jgi:hypothetical protein
MQTFTKALIEQVVAGKVDRETAANAASNRHDFLVALDKTAKQRAVEDGLAQRAAAEAAAAQAAAEAQARAPAEEPEFPALRLAQPGG